MNNDQDLKQLWQQQTTPSVVLTPEVLQKQANTFQRRIAWRNGTEYAAGVLVIAVFAFYIKAFPFWLMRLGSAMIIVGSLVLMWQMRRRASSQRTPGSGADMSCLDFHRAALVRQRDALRSVWLWYVGPLVPGMVVFRYGVETALDASAPFARGWIANLTIALVLLIVIGINLLAARKLQRQIDKLDREAADHGGTSSSTDS